MFTWKDLNRNSPHKLMFSMFGSPQLWAQVGLFLHIVRNKLKRAWKWAIIAKQKSPAAGVIPYCYWLELRILKKTLVLMDKESFSSPHLVVWPVPYFPMASGSHRVISSPHPYPPTLSHSLTDCGSVLNPMSSVIPSLKLGNKQNTLLSGSVVMASCLNKCISLNQL